MSKQTKKHSSRTMSLALRMQRRFTRKSAMRGKQKSINEEEETDESKGLLNRFVVAEFKQNVFVDEDE